MRGAFMPDAHFYPAIVVVVHDVSVEHLGGTLHDVFGPVDFNACYPEFLLRLGDGLVCLLDLCLAHATLYA